ncbi:MAG: SDR family oxidoreductase [Saprospirales bacterium]|nr:SDR family oxidoreductase [Saprospirales bacterium]
MAPPIIFLTGGAGYLGRIVLRQLAEDLSAGKIARLISTDIREVPEDQRLEGIDYEVADIRDATRLKTLMDQYNPSTVIHLAAVIDSHSMPRNIQYQIDVEGTRNVVEACLHAGVDRLIVSSSGAAYGYHADNPDWLTEAHPLRGNAIFAYSDHKRQVEEMLGSYRESHPELEQIILRLSTVLGTTTDNLITRLFHRKSMLGVKGYDSPFVFIWDEDAAACFRHAVFSPVTGIFNVAGDGAIPASQLAILMGKPYRAIPPGLFRILLQVLHALRISPYGPEQMLFLQFRPVLDNRRLKEEFGFLPRKTSKETFESYISL